MKMLMGLSPDLITLGELSYQLLILGRRLAFCLAVGNKKCARYAPQAVPGIFHSPLMLTGRP